MSEDVWITKWIERLKAGDRDVCQRLWEQYFEKLVRLANQRLPRGARRAFDEEDVALSAFKSFALGAEQGRFPQLVDRDDLWSILFVITVRKADYYLRHASRQKRGGGKVLGESGLHFPGDAPMKAIEQILDQEPTPELLTEMLEEVEHLLALLQDEGLQQIAMLRMQGHTIEEIAQQAGLTRRTIDRRLQLIRRKWSESPTDEES